MYWSARVPGGTPTSNIHSLILCSIWRFGPSFGESFHSFEVEGNKKVGYFPVNIFISSRNRKIGCDHNKFLNPFSGQQHSTGSAGVLEVRIAPMMTPFFNRKFEISRVSDHLNDAWTMINRALQKILRPSELFSSTASFSSSFTWNASNAGAYFFGVFLAILELFAIMGWSRFQSNPRTFLKNLNVVFLK